MNYNSLINSIVHAKTNEYPNRCFQLKNPVSRDGVFIANAQNWGDNSKQVALKIHKLMTDNEKNFIYRLIQYQNTYEKGNYSNYPPTHIIQIFDYFQSQQYHYIVMEVGQESLLDCIKQNKNGSIKDKENICFQITLSIVFLHKQKLIHKDIKPKNFIKVGNVFKLFDFGLIMGSISFELSINQDPSRLIFQAPEIIQNSNRYTDKVDIWSLACVFYEILTSSPLIDGQSFKQVEQQILNHKINPNYVYNKISNMNTSQTIKHLLTKMLAFEESMRPTIQQVQNELDKYLNETGHRTELEIRQMSEKIKILESKLITEQQIDNQIQKHLEKQSQIGSQKFQQFRYSQGTLLQTSSQSFHQNIQTDLKQIQEKFLQLEIKLKSQQEEKDKQIESLTQQVYQESNEKKFLEEKLNTVLTQLQKQQLDFESKIDNQIKSMSGQFSQKKPKETTVINPNLQNYIEYRLQDQFEIIKQYINEEQGTFQQKVTNQIEQFKQTVLQLLQEVCDQQCNSQNNIDSQTINNDTEQQDLDKQNVSRNEGLNSNNNDTEQQSLYKQNVNHNQGLNSNNNDNEQQNLDKQNVSHNEGLNSNKNVTEQQNFDKQNVSSSQGVNQNDKEVITSLGDQIYQKDIQDKKLFFERQQYEKEFQPSYFTSKSSTSALVQNLSNIQQSSQIETKIEIYNYPINQQLIQPEQGLNQENKQIQSQENNQQFQINQSQSQLQNLPSEVQIEQYDQQNSQLEESNQQQINEHGINIILQNDENKYQNQIKQLTQDVENLKNQLDNANQENKQLHINNKELENKNKELMLKFENLYLQSNVQQQIQPEVIDEQNSEYQNNQSSLTVQNNQIIIDNKNLKQNFEMLQQTSQVEILELKTENDQLYQRIKELEENNKNLNSDLGQLKQEKTEKVNQLLELVNENQYLQNSLNQTNQPLTQVNALCDYFKNNQNIKEFAENHNNDFQTLLSLLNS